MTQLSPKNITRIKNITNDTGRAYDIEDKEFILHFPNRFRKRILDTKTDELLVLYQTINNKRFLTHLVRPIDNEVIEENAPGIVWTEKEKTDCKRKNKIGKAS